MAASPFSSFMCTHRGGSRARWSAGAIDAAEGGAERKAADTAHAIDADAHNQWLHRSDRLPPASSSSRAFIAMRSRDANGSAAKISMRRRRLA